MNILYFVRVVLLLCLCAFSTISFSSVKWNVTASPSSPGGKASSLAEISLQEIVERSLSKPPLKNPNNDQFYLFDYYSSEEVMFYGDIQRYYHYKYATSPSENVAPLGFGIGYTLYGQSPEDACIAVQPSNYTFVSIQPNAGGIAYDCIGLNHDYGITLAYTPVIPICTGGFNSTSLENCRMHNYLDIRIWENIPLEELPGPPDLCEDNPTNPISLATGNKFQKETDYLSNYSNGLSFERYYNSEAAIFSRNSIGVNWSHTYDRYLSKVGTAIFVKRHDGKIIVFNENNGQWESNDPRFSLSEESTGYIFTQGGLVEKYDIDGALISIENTSNIITLNYNSDNQLDYIYNNYGLSIAIEYSAGLISKVIGDESKILNYMYDDLGNLIEVYLPDETPEIPHDGTKISYEYSNLNFRHSLTGKRNESGDLIAQWTYNDNGKPVSSAHAGNVDLANVTYNSDGSTTVENGLGKAATHYYTEINGKRLIDYIEGHQSATCSSAAKDFDYYPNGLLRNKTDWNGNLTTYGYDQAGREVLRIEASGTDLARLAETKWHSVYSKPIQIKEYEDQGSKLLRTTEYTYTNSGLLESRTIIDPVSNTQRTWNYEYYAEGETDGLPGQLKSVDGPRDDVIDITYYRYNDVGLVSEVENAMGHVTKILEYESSGQPSVMQDENGVLTILSYDARGRLVSRSISDAITKFEYDIVGNLDKIIFPNNTFLDYSYDVAGRLTDIYDSEGNHIHYELNALGGRTLEEIKDSSGMLVNKKSKIYDELNRLIHVVGAKDQTLTNEYDANGNIKNHTDANSMITSKSYDALNRLINIVDTNSGTTVLSYESEVSSSSNSDVGDLCDGGGEIGFLPADPIGDIPPPVDPCDGQGPDPFQGVSSFSVQDPKSSITKYTYNAFGDLLKLESPDSGITKYTYDNAGNLVSKTDARDIEITYQYDVLNRLTNVVYPSQNENITYIYDGTSEGDFGISRLTQIIDESGMTKYKYYARGTLAEEIRTISGYQYSIKYQYDIADSLTHIIYPSGLEIEYVRNEHGKVFNVIAIQSGETIQLGSNIEYLPFGSLKNLDFGNGYNLSRSHDLDYRVNNQVVTNGEIIQDMGLDYDQAGNVIQINNELDISRTQSFAYDSLYRLGIAGGIYGNRMYDYDAVGNRNMVFRNSDMDIYTTDSSSNKTMNVFGSNSFDIEYDEVGNITKKGSYSYIYNQANRMMEAKLDSNLVGIYKYNALGQRTQKTANQNTVTFIYDQAGRIIAEYDNEVLKIEYVYLDGVLLAARHVSTEEFQEGGWFYYHNDHLGTPQIVTNKNGEISWQADYSPFGQVSLVVNSVEQNFRFPGQYYDKETNLYYNYYRYYDPSLGRYLTSDPIGLRGGLNTYSYVNGNPLRFIDELGLKYTDEECKLLLEWIRVQLLTYQEWQYRYENGKPSREIKPIASTPDDCAAVYKDEGRRLACEAHEQHHIDQNHQIKMLNPGFILWPPLYGKVWANYEMEAHLVGIQEGERQYEENCLNTCNN